MCCYECARLKSLYSILDIEQYVFGWSRKMRSMRNDIQHPRGIERTYARIAPRIISKNYSRSCNFAEVKSEPNFDCSVNYDVSS